MSRIGAMPRASLLSRVTAITGSKRRCPREGREDAGNLRQRLMGNSGRPIRSVQLVQSHRPDVGDSDRAGAAAREIDDKFHLARRTVVDAHDDRALIAQIDDAQPRPERERFMRRRESVWIVLLAARGAAGMLVPGGAAGADALSSWRAFPRGDIVA